MISIFVLLTSITSEPPALNESHAEEVPPPAQGSGLVDAQTHLELGDPAFALESLEKMQPPLSLEEYAKRDELAGIAHAQLGNDDDAERRFARLLIVQPDHSLSYTRSPKVAFPYERARKARSSGAALQVRVQAPLVLAWNEEIPLDVAVTGNPQGLLKELEVCRRLKQVDARECVKIESPPTRVTLPAIAPASAGTDGLALIETRGFDEQGNEIYRPLPVEIPIGFAPPPPWYTSAWLWGGVAAGVAVVATTATLVVINANRPTQAEFVLVNP